MIFIIISYLLLQVGIVGQNISGKDSVPAVLYRLAEPKGTVRFDGVDISQLGLHDFRRKISVIPAVSVCSGFIFILKLYTPQQQGHLQCMGVLEGVSFMLQNIHFLCIGLLKKNKLSKSY